MIETIFAVIGAVILGGLVFAACGFVVMWLSVREDIVELAKLELERKRKEGE